jgi:hypothetical protein
MSQVFGLNYTFHGATCTVVIMVISLLISPLLGHRLSLWITHKENEPLPTTRA